MAAQVVRSEKPKSGNQRTTSGLPARRRRAPEPASSRARKRRRVRPPDTPDSGNLRATGQEQKHAPPNVQALGQFARATDRQAATKKCHRETDTASPRIGLGGHHAWPWRPHGSVCHRAAPPKIGDTLGTPCGHPAGRPFCRIVHPTREVYLARRGADSPMIAAIYPSVPPCATREQIGRADAYAPLDMHKVALCTPLNAGRTSPRMTRIGGDVTVPPKADCRTAREDQFGCLHVRHGCGHRSGYFGGATTIGTPDLLNNIRASPSSAGTSPPRGVPTPLLNRS